MPTLGERGLLQLAKAACFSTVQVEITSKGKGKAGGARVITYTVLTDQATGEVWLVDIYDKSEYATVKLDVIKEMLKELNI